MQAFGCRCTHGFDRSRGVEPGTGNASRLNQVVQQGWLSGHRSIPDLSSHEGYPDFRPTWAWMGTELISESYVEGGPLGFDKEGRMLGREIIHKVYLEVWYIYKGKRGTIKQFGATTFLSRDAYGTISSDEDHAKKSITDATSKCLSLLGFSADVYMGKFDDHKYVEGLKAKMEAAGNPATGMTSTEATVASDTQQQSVTGSASSSPELSSRYLIYKTKLQEYQEKVNR